MYLKGLNRKGDIKFVVEILLIIIAFLAILPIFINEFFPKATDISSRSSCQESFILKANTDIPVVGPNIDLACSTNVYNYESSDITSVQKLIAEELYYCWWQFGEGKVELGKWKINGPGYACFVCANVKFKESMLKSFPGSKTIDMANYLNNYFIPGSTKETYSQYFLGKNEGFSNQNIRNDLTFNDNIFVVYRFKDTLTGFKADFALEDSDSVSKNCNSIQDFKVNNKKGL
ncbi:hypothetical protein J4455_01025 [Candidatus Woesearchaeota archaeon]|nr:hypothetical protein [Candidatus Woesearchaeota archaeon]